jgi:hypothetical protein
LDDPRGYIDESGIFSNPANKPNIASVVAALIVPSRNKVRVFDEFREVSAEWPHDEDEIKGRLLNERQITTTAKMLQRYDCVVEMNIIDIGIHTEEELAEFQKGMCDQIAGWATEKHPEDFKKEVGEIAAALQKPKSPIFVEAFLLTVLIPRILNIGINYYARHIPKELKGFHWVIDAKDKAVTNFETAWHKIILPSIQHQTKQHPILRIENGDYTYFEPYYHLSPELAERARKDLEGEENKVAFDVAPIFRDFKFQDSKDVIGLQLADILANATQRALNGKLPDGGYEEIGGLMVTQEDLAIRIIRMDPKAEVYHPIKVKSPFHDPINRMLKHTKPLWGSQEQEANLARQALKRNKEKFGYAKAFSGIGRPRK